MEFVLYPVIVALLVVLLVLYRIYNSKQQELKGSLETRMERLKREMAGIESDMGKMNQKTDAVGKELTSLKHGLTSVSNQIVGMRSQDTAENIAERPDTQIRTLEIVGMRTHDSQDRAPECEKSKIPTLE